MIMTNQGIWWCDRCQCYVKKSEMKTETNDADEIVYSCPGCDYDVWHWNVHIGDFLADYDHRRGRREEETDE